MTEIYMQLFHVMWAHAIQASSTARTSYGSPHYLMLIHTMCMICHACIFSWLQIFNQQSRKNMEVLLCDYRSMDVVRCELWGCKASNVHWVQVRSVQTETQILKPDNHLRALFHACDLADKRQVCWCSGLHIRGFQVSHMQMGQRSPAWASKLSNLCLFRY